MSEKSLSVQQLLLLAICKCSKAFSRESSSGRFKTDRAENEQSLWEEHTFYNVSRWVNNEAHRNDKISRQQGDVYGIGCFKGITIMLMQK